MKRHLVVIFLALMVGILPAAPSSAAPSMTAGKAAPAPSVAAGWEKQWNNVLEAGKKEGIVVIYSLWRPETRTTLTKAFLEKYGIKLQFLPFSKGSDLMVRVQKEKQAGLNAVDVIGGGYGTLVATMKPAGLLGSLNPLLMLPEVLDPKVWRAGKVPLADEEGTALGMIEVVIRTVVYNTNLIDGSKITSYKDLLEPQYKGKITMDDPSVTGPANGVLTHLGHSLWGETETVDFLRRLIRDQGIDIQRDDRIQMESVARGKYAVALCPLPDLSAEFISLGAPVKPSLVKEDNRLATAAGVLGVPGQIAHPNAARVFINWLLTKEGQTLFSQSFGNPSSRADVSTKEFSPLLVPVAGKKYYSEMDALAQRGKWLGIAKKVMSEAKQ